MADVMQCIADYNQPPSGGCVLKQQFEHLLIREGASRLQAAVC